MMKSSNERHDKQNTPEQKDGRGWNQPRWTVHRRPIVSQHEGPLGRSFHVVV